MSVFRGEAKRCGILVVEFVNMFVEQGRVEQLMSCGHREVRQYGSKKRGKRGGSTNRNSGTCPRRKRRMRVGGAWLSTTGKAPARCSCQRTQRRGGRGKSFGNRDEQSTKTDQRHAYGWPLNGKVRKEDSPGTLPLLLWCRHLAGLQLPLAEVWDCINDDPRYAATEIHGLDMQKVQSFI